MILCLSLKAAYSSLFDCVKPVSFSLSRNKETDLNLNPNIAKTVSLSANASRPAVQPPSSRSSTIHHPQPLSLSLPDIYFLSRTTYLIKWEIFLELTVSIYYIVSHLVLFAHLVFIISTATFPSHWKRVPSISSPRIFFTGPTTPLRFALVAHAIKRFAFHHGSAFILYVYFFKCLFSICFFLNLISTAFSMRPINWENFPSTSSRSSAVAVSQAKQ